MCLPSSLFTTKESTNKYRRDCGTTVSKKKLDKLSSSVLEKHVALKSILSVEGSEGVVDDFSPSIHHGDNEPLFHVESDVEGFL